MIPVIAIVGRPNVGKSTLFNCLTQSRDAVVADIAGVTRDRQYGQGKVGDKPYVVIDTGGIGEDHGGIESLTAEQAQLAVIESDVLLFVVDARRGLAPADSVIAKQLRKLGKKVFLVINKVDGLDTNVAIAEFHRLGLGDPIGIAASHHQGVEQLMRHVLKHLPKAEEIIADDKAGIKIAIAGKPNVGKSTLVNRLLGEERVIVFDAPGTTRDSIYIPFERFDKKYTLIDTAGVRKRGQVTDVLEKISVVKTLQSISEANVVILVIDARSGVTEQDLHLLGFILDAGKSLVIAINKWDGLTKSDKDEVKRGLDRRLVFVDFAEIHFISALHGTGVGHLFEAVDRAYASATKILPTPLVSKILEKAVIKHQPPLVQGRRIKLRYAHVGGHNPPIIVIHGNQTKNLPEAYRRYLSSTYRKALKLVGTPIRIQLKDSNNPFAGRPNPLSDKQFAKRTRAIKNRKKTAKK